ncbi:hypothetical protein NIES39_D01710 [Arthrospira platensis NIES-39]|nr:hypothetical protein NIES39_D01710 [Arthrospira platensis NIES-39]
MSDRLIFPKQGGFMGVPKRNLLSETSAITNLMMGNIPHLFLGIDILFYKTSNSIEF